MLRAELTSDHVASRIPFNKPLILGKELGYVTQVVSTGAIASDGPFTRRCAQLMEDRFGIPKVLMTPSCTAALEMAAMLCDLEPGDDVLVPSFTFVSTVNAFVRMGARPVFVDIRPDTLTIDEELLEAAVTPRARAVFPVHYAGVSCEMDPILRIAQSHNLRVVEDAAQGVNAWYKGRALGSMGELGTYSFHDTKNVVCGEGALCINNPALIERAEIIRDKGTNRAKFFRGKVDKYSWVDVGSSYIPSELSCAFLCAQLEGMDLIKRRGQEVSRCYRALLAPLAERGLLRLRSIPPYGESPDRGFYILLSDGATRDGLMAYLKTHGVSAVFHFVPLHTSPMGMSYGYQPGDLPVTEDLAARLLRLPAFYEITEKQQTRVSDLISQFLRRPAESAGPALSVSQSLAAAVCQEARR